MQQYRFKYDVIISHKSCVDGSTSSWIVWRSLPQSYRDILAQEGGFYALPSSNSDSSESSNSSKFIHPNSPKGAMNLQEKGYPLIFVFISPNESLPIKLIQNKRVLILDLDL